MRYATVPIYPLHTPRKINIHTYTFDKRKLHPRLLHTTIPQFYSKGLLKLLICNFCISCVMDHESSMDWDLFQLNNWVYFSLIKRMKYYLWLARTWHHEAKWQGMPHTHGCMALSMCHSSPEMVGEALPAANILSILYNHSSSMVPFIWVEKDSKNIYLEDIVLNISLAVFDLSNLFSDGYKSITEPVQLSLYTKMESHL